MAGHIKDYSGKTFGELYVVSLAYLKNHRTFYNCKCSCGKETVVYSNCLTAGHTKSCGHLQQEHCQRLKVFNAISDQDIENGIKVGVPRMKKYLKNKYNNSCQLCGWGEVNPFLGKVSLDLHHLDSDHNNTILSNVQLLCPNCHSLTESYKGMNMNRSTRINRRKEVSIEVPNL